MKIISCIYSFSGFIIIHTVEGWIFIDECRGRPVLRGLPLGFIEEGKARIRDIFKPLEKENEDT